MRVLIVTDAWRPQVNGVVRVLESLAEAAKEQGVDIVFLTPEGFWSIAVPTYAEVRLALTTCGPVGRRIEAAQADHIHLATEGPLGLAARRYCLRHDLPFTTSFHTKLPEYIAARVPVPLSWSYRLLRVFHNAGSGVLVSTSSLEADLKSRGFNRLMRWPLGVDNVRFRRRDGSVLNFPRPLFLYVGRIAIEKNLAAFLRLDLPGTKVVVGDGPARASLEASFPDARFLGTQTGEDLADIYSSADVFVFPSLTDTFGLVLLEAMASGLPVAAFPVAGALDVVDQSGAGVLDMDLKLACLEALSIPRWKPRARSEAFSWDESASHFIANLLAANPA
ncbi:MAG: glycosyltransferase family 1 protein [Beijerinckiaceae bacterium]